MMSNVAPPFIDLDLLNKLIPYTIKTLSPKKLANLSQALQSRNILRLTAEDFRSSPPFMKGLEDSIKLRLMEYNDNPKTLINTLEPELNWLTNKNTKLIDSCHPGWRDSHTEIKPAVHSFFLQGDEAVLEMPSIAIVGSRSASSQDSQLAFRLAADLSEMNICIISGLAEGIDSAAHKGALVRKGKTIAVLGHGLDSTYPACNQSLKSEIAKSGSIVSQYSIDHRGRSYQFLQRNQLIASLADYVLIVAATGKSGSLSTANYGLALGRDIMAVPGSVHDKRHSGCHHLIQQGAHLVQNIEDIIALIQKDMSQKILLPSNSNLANSSPVKTKNSSNVSADVITVPEHRKVYSVLSADALSEDQIASLTNLSVNLVVEALIHIQLAGLIHRRENGWTKV